MRFQGENYLGLTSVTIPSSVKIIGEGAFTLLPKLTDVYYAGTKSDWEKISIYSDNYPLTGATIHYGSDAPSPSPQPTATPKPTPTPTPKPIPVTMAEIARTDAETDTEYGFDVNTADKYENCYVYAAVYDADGVLLAVNRVPLELTGSTSISLDKRDNATMAKVFVWADTLRPVAEAEEISLI